MQPDSSLSRPGALVKIAVEVGGIPLHMFHQAGDIYVPGTPGRAYVLSIINRTDTRVEVVTSIDGRNTLKDEAAGFMNGGMVLRPRETWRNRGWRVDDNTSREFIFGDDPEDSVAVQATGSTANIGVIGFAAFRELRRAPRPVHIPVRMRDICDVSMRGGPGGMSVAASAGMDYDLSTGIGEEQDDRVGRTEFKRTGTPDVLTIKYASYESLLARGIIRCERCEPDPFPGNGYSRMRSPRARA